MAGGLPPHGTNFISVIQPTLTGVLISHSFVVLLLPLIIALFYFSSRRSRVKPIFILNLVAIALTFTSGVMLEYRGLRTILSPEHLPPTSINLAVGVLGAVTSILVDTILLLRLIAVYPRAYVGQSKFIQLITLPIIVKIARVINLLIFIKELAVRAHNPVAISKFWVSAPYLKIEWFMQLFDNAYASGFFLWRLALRTKEDRSWSVHSASTVSFADKLKTLIWISITNFVVPALFSLAQIIIVYREVNYVIVNDIVLVNTKLSVFGVVFATIWAGTNGKRHGSEEGSTDADSAPPREPALSALVFQSRNADTTRSGEADVESGAQVEEKEKRDTD